METKFIEAENVGPEGQKFNWGKFMLGRFTEEEWHISSEIDRGSIISARGWSDKHILVFDLQTGEGAMFLPGGFARADLNKHKIWVCPLFEPFLVWLYKQNLYDLTTLPNLVSFTIDEAPFEMVGHRRKGI